MDADDQLNPLDLAYVKAVRVTAAIVAICALVPVLIGIGAALPWWMMLLPIALAVWLVAAYPPRRYKHMGYALGEDRLRIVRGNLFRKDTVVPLGRIQHLDVEQGPIERRYGLATLSVHTAGSHNATVNLPGLPHDQAIAMRDAIRDYIKKAQS